MTKANDQLADAENTLPVAVAPRLPEGEPPEGVAGLIGDYPGLAIAAGLGIGLLAGALLPRSAGRKLARGAVFLASAGGELGLALGKQALQAADEATREGRGKLSGTASEVAHDLSGRASDLAERASDLGTKAAEAGRTVSAGAQRIASDASDRARDAGAGLVKLAIDTVSRIRN